MLNLTYRQQQILDFVRNNAEQRGMMPTLQEIAEEFGFRSVNSAAEHLRLIRKKGFLSPSLRKARGITIVSPLQKLRAAISDIPVLGSIPAGLAQAREQGAESCITVDVNSIGYKPTKNSFALRVSGDSMIGRHIMSGDYVVLEHGPEPRNGEIVAALIDGECTLKTYVVKGGKPYLKAENPKFPNLIPAHELVIQGVFRALIRPAQG